MKRRPSIAIVLLVALVAISAVGVVLARSPAGGERTSSGLAANPVLDPGTAISGPAHDFTLVDQFGRRVSLRSFRGRMVILAFNDSQCTTVCPLTTTAMVDAQQMLGAAGRRVQLLGIDANPQATAVKDVRAYSVVHHMLDRWHFLTGSLAQLEHVWKGYGISVQITRGQIDHTPALFVIDPRGNLTKVYLTQMSYASVPQLGQILAHEASSLLPGHPRVASSLSYARIAPIVAGSTVTLPRAGGGRVRLGPGRARLQLFFATWTSETVAIAAQLAQLDRYQSAAAADGLPPVTAVDEASVEPSPSALPRFLRDLSRPVSYPVAIDRSGRLADGYEVQDQPWFVLTSRSGQIIWYYDVSTQGLLSAAALRQDVRAALSRPPKVPASRSAASGSGYVAGSPPELAALHAQAGQLLGSDGALLARIRALRGYPVVLNAWASWCTPCQQEFPLFASAEARYGRRVAFLGVDTTDVAGDAQSFLTKHPAGYPSYQSASTQIGSLVALLSLPTTIFIDQAGKVVSLHNGQYAAQGTLDQDIERYALGG